MTYLSLSISISDIANQFDGHEGEAFAELFNEIVRDGPMPAGFLVDFAEHLDSEGRGFLLQLLDGVKGYDAEEGR